VRYNQIYRLVVESPPGVYRVEIQRREFNSQIIKLSPPHQNDEVVIKAYKKINPGLIAFLWGFLFMDVTSQVKPITSFLAFGVAMLQSIRSRLSL